MPYSQVVLQASGPLPIKGQFTFQSTSAATIFVSGTAYASQPGPIAVTLSVAGVTNASASVWANEAQSHKALITSPTPSKIPFGEQQFVLEAAPNTLTDSNDRFSVVIVY